MERLQLLLMSLVFTFFPVAALATEVGAKADSAEGLGYLSAAIAVSAATLGSGIAVAVVGAAAMGAIAEKPELAGRALIFVGLAEGIAIYGLIVALMILARL
ncbi:MAG: F0F1 ATP synthase subunit C [Deltaproteobacteria bacterium]|nr:F0F1 ATP synthase subunit C [Deltaproteobacteria bacterium]